MLPKVDYNRAGVPLGGDSSPRPVRHRRQGASGHRRLRAAHPARHLPEPGRLRGARRSAATCADVNVSLRPGSRPTRP